MSEWLVFGRKTEVLSSLPQSTGLCLLSVISVLLFIYWPGFY